MFWNLSFQLMPDEKIIADSTQIKQSRIIKATCSVILTNKRVIFRFDGLGSSLTQNFLPNEFLMQVFAKGSLLNKDSKKFLLPAYAQSCLLV
jgi:hypothetical protein